MAEHRVSDDELVVSLVSALARAGRWDTALGLIDELALSGSEDDGGRSDVLRAEILTDLDLQHGGAGAELEAVLDRLEERLQQGDAPALRAFVLDRRGRTKHREFLSDRSAGEPVGELELFEEALAIRRRLGYKAAISESLFHVGLVHQVVRGDDEQARPYFDEAYELAMEARAYVLASYAVRHIAYSMAERGQHSDAERAFRESFDLRVEAGAVGLAAAALGALGEFFAEAGDVGRGRRLLAQAVVVSERIGAGRLADFLRRDLEALTG